MEAGLAERETTMNEKKMEGDKTMPELNEHNVKDQVSRSEHDELVRVVVAIDRRFDEETKLIGDNMVRVAKRLDALEARQPQTPKPKCRLCNDTKIELRCDVDRGWRRVLCPCVKPGDVVTAEVANLLPVGSRVRDKIFPQGVWWERTATEWKNNSDKFARVTLDELTFPSWEVICIGPAPEAPPDDAHPSNCACPDCEPEESETLDIPLATLLADPRLRPLVNVVDEAIKYNEHAAPYLPLMFAVEAIPRELREAIEAVE
jgi:hypothetical protein